MAVPKLPLVLFPEQAIMNKSPEHSGILTPPLHTLASVPFRWEEQPGKPRPCTDIIPLPTSVFDEPKCLEPPPRLLYLEFTKTPSPTNNKLSSTSSFRFLKGRVEKGPLGSLVVYKKNKVRRGHWWQRYVKRKGKVGNRENVGGGSFVFPSSSSVDSSTENGGSGSDDQGVKMKRLRRNGSFSSLSQSRSTHIWGAIYEGFKQVIPWKSKKSKKCSIYKKSSNKS